MKLYEFGPTRALRARWTLQELGIQFESFKINLLAGEASTPEFLRLNPAAKLPVLVDDDQILTESVAIVLYLRPHCRGPAHFPLRHLRRRTALDGQVAPARGGREEC
jgi:glutathione S-transferase